MVRSAWLLPTLPNHQPSALLSRALVPGWLAAVLRVWVLALALSAAVVAAGARWPQPLTPDSRWLGVLVLGVPLLMGLALLSRWAPPAPPPDRGRGESGD